MSTSCNSLHHRPTTTNVTFPIASNRNCKLLGMIPRPSFSRLPVIVWVFPLAVYEVHGFKKVPQTVRLLLRFFFFFFSRVEHWRMWHGGAIRAFSKFHERENENGKEVWGIKFFRLDYTCSTTFSTIISRITWP